MEFKLGIPARIAGQLEPVAEHAAFDQQRLRPGDEVLRVEGQLALAFTIGADQPVGRLEERERRQAGAGRRHARSEEHTSELQSLMRISYAVFCLKTKIKTNT